MLRQPPVLDMEGGIKLTHEPDIPGDLAPRARYDLIGSSLLRLKTSVNDLQLPKPQRGSGTRRGTNPVPF